MKVFSCFFFCALCFFFCALFAQERAEGELSGTAKTEGAQAGNASVFFQDGRAPLNEGTALFSDGSLRRYFDGSDRLLLDNRASSSLRCSDDKVVQKKLDSSYRLVQTTVWKPSSASPVMQTDYFYKGDSPFPERSVTRDEENLQTVYEFYGEKGLWLKKETYAAAPERTAADGKNAAALKTAAASPVSTAKSSAAKKEKLLYRETASYDDQFRMTEYKIAYEPEASPDKNKARSEKTEYLYRKGGDKADIFYSVNGERIKQRIYTDTKDWEETLFFPGNVRIVTVYKNENRSAEIVYENGVKKRERTL